MKLGIFYLENGLISYSPHIYFVPEKFVSFCQTETAH